MKRKNNGLKKIFYIYGGILLLLFITCITVYSIYNSKLKEATKQSLIAAEKMENIVPNNIIEDVSLQISQTIQEALQENKQEETNQSVENNVVETVEPTNTMQEVQPAEPVEEIKPLEFMYPVEGSKIGRAHV